mmetsp:Transcript_18267/g.51232  ORF Transcript_18267/g.51232 Transcript_18267/m.51232 type:complete len:201 (-) Transcript_18267:117-719(-)
MCMPHFGGVALSAVLGGLARLGHRPSPSLSAAAMRRASALLLPEVRTSLQCSITSSKNSSRSSSKGLEGGPSSNSLGHGASVERVSKAWGGPANPGDLLTPWQLVVVLHSLACMQCPATRQWVLGMLEAWKALRLGVIKGGGRDEAPSDLAQEGGLLSDEELDGIVFEEVEEVHESARREHGALLQVIRTYNLPRSVLEN